MGEWVRHMLNQRRGPEKVLDILYNRDGSANEFLRLLQSIEGNGPGARDFKTLREEKLHGLQARSLDNRDENGQPGRYYVGSLYTKDGELTTHKLTLTAAGKMQLFLNDNSALEITLRDVVGKQWIQKLVDMEREERMLRKEYNEELAEKRELSRDMYHCQLTTMIDKDMDPVSVKAVLRGSARETYHAILPGFKSGTDAGLVVEGKVRMCSSYLGAMLRPTRHYACICVDTRASSIAPLTRLHSRVTSRNPTLQAPSALDRRRRAL